MKVKLAPEGVLIKSSANYLSSVLAELDRNYSHALCDGNSTDVTIAVPSEAINLLKNTIAMLKLNEKSTILADFMECDTCEGWPKG